MKNIFGLILTIVVFNFQTKAQGCCSGGSGSPMVGGVSMGVLQQGQFDFSESYQYFYSDKFMAGKIQTVSPLVKELSSNYFYTRLGYGISSKFSLYAELGYFEHKTERGTDNTRPDYLKKSTGLADFILFPRYLVFEKSSAKLHSELTLGAGLKIPLGNYHDSGTVYIDPNNGKVTKAVLPPTVQTTSGSNDFIFYGFYLLELKKQKLKLFSSVTYMHKGYNGMGEKFGDFAAIGIFANRPIGKRWGLTLQTRYEWIDKMQVSPNVDFVAQGISVEPASTGAKKISLVPQITYTKKSLTVFTLYDFPVYQYLNGMQLASKHLFTLGINYRFKPKPNLFKKQELK